MEHSTKLLTKIEASERARIKPATIMKLCKSGKGPTITKLGGRVSSAKSISPNGSRVTPVQIDERDREWVGAAIANIQSPGSRLRSNSLTNAAKSATENGFA